MAALENNVFAGNGDGVYFSNDNGQSFILKSEGFSMSFENAAVQGLSISPQFVFAGLFQNSIWKRPLSDFGIISKPAVAKDTELPSLSSPVKNAQLLSVTAVSEY